MMAARVGLARAVAPQVPVLVWLASHDEYRIGVGAPQPENPPEWRWERVTIAYCPWCGTKLPPSRHQEWFDELVRRGYTDPGNDDIPDAFKSDSWWRET